MDLDLNGSWNVYSADKKFDFQGQVPGSFFLELEKSGYWPGGDVFYRENNRQCDEISNQDFVYEKTFSVSKEFLSSGNRFYLSAEGLDTLAEIVLNGNLAAETKNMHIHYMIDITDMLQENENTLFITFRNTTEEADKLDEARHIWSTNKTIPGSNQIRKSFCSFGWDWGPSIPDAGIWRPIKIISFTDAHISDVNIDQVHFKNKAELIIRADVEQWENKGLAMHCEILNPSGKVVAEKTDSAFLQKHEIDKPLLWWPNNLGDQPLYTVNIFLLKNGQTIDSSQKKIGLRTLVLHQEDDEWGRAFGFCINDQIIFAMGANIIPQDVYLPRVNPSKTRKLLEDCAAANFNCVRVWGGGIYPDNVFYDICDELGLIVWQDLMFSCSLYPAGDEEFVENITAEITANMKRIRHHASLGLICGNNEMEWAFTDWPEVVWDEQNKAEYVRQYEYILPALLAEICPEIAYWKASPSSGGFFNKPNDPNSGDVHYWNIWHGGAPFTDFRKFYFRFLSEYGFQSFPSMKTISSFTEPDDLNIYSPVLEDHQRNGDGAGNQKVMRYAGEYFRIGSTLSDHVYISQLSQAEAGRYAVEHMRQNRGRCLGSLYWQLNDNWPVSSWSSIDYFGRWKALHYSMKRAYAPVSFSAREEGRSVELYLSNETASEVKGVIKWQLRDLNGKVILEDTIPAKISPFSGEKQVSLDFHDVIPKNSRNHYLYAIFTPKAGNSESFCVVFERYKKVNLQNPELSISVSESGNEITVSALGFAKFVNLEAVDLDIVFSDNFFDLAHGESITLTCSSSIKEKSRINIFSLYDSYTR